MIIGFSGKKQSGKSTSGNFLVSIVMANLGIAEHISLNPDGLIVISDLFGDRLYQGVFDASISRSNDFMMQKALDTLSPHIKLYSFADVLKQDICMNVLGLTREQCYGSDESKNSHTGMFWEDRPMTPRDIMQFIGTDIFRKLQPNIWVDATMRKIQSDNSQIAVITDCRFPNEVSAIQNNQGKVVRLNRAPFESDHISETILDANNFDWKKFDYIIDNQKMSIYNQCLELEKIFIEVMSL